MSPPFSLSRQVLRYDAHAMSIRKLAIVYISSLLLAGCAGYIPFAYEVPVQQGNIITDDMVAQLRPGMSQEQVRYVLGTPAIEDPFHADRWDYVYALDEEDKAMQVDRLTVFFRDGRLSRVEGSLAPEGLDGSDS